LQSRCAAHRKRALEATGVKAADVDAVLKAVQKERKNIVEGNGR
jgi:hypothetical protein